MTTAELDELKQSIITELHELEFYQTEGLTLKELVQRLNMVRAMKIEVKSPHSQWF